MILSKILKIYNRILLVFLFIKILKLFLKFKLFTLLIFYTDHIFTKAETHSTKGKKRHIAIKKITSFNILK